MQLEYFEFLLKAKINLDKNPRNKGNAKAIIIKLKFDWNWGVTVGRINYYPINSLFVELIINES